MFYSDFGAHHYTPKVWECCVAFFYGHLSVYVNHRLVQSAGYGDIVWG